MSNSAQPPIWNLKAFYPALNSIEYLQDKQKLKDSTARLIELSQNIKNWTTLVLAIENWQILFGHLRCYLLALSSLDPSQAEIRTELDHLNEIRAQSQKVNNLLLNQLKLFNEDEFTSFLNAPELAELQFHLRQQRDIAISKMDIACENLVVDLNRNGALAWANLYHNLISSLSFEVEINGDKKTISMGERRTWMEDPDPAIRKIIFHASNKVYRKNKLCFESSLNGIVGSRLAILSHRNQTDYLTYSFWQNRISRNTVEALMTACQKVNPKMQAYFRSKESRMKRPFGYYDLEGADLNLDLNNKRFTWDEAWKMIEDSFSVYPKLLTFAQEMLTDERIEARPNLKKSPGGYCDGSSLNKKAYIYQTFGGSVGDTLTLAHELGHAFHHYIAKDLRPYHADNPMTLAETASTFCEALMNQTLISSSTINASLKKQLEQSEKDRACAFLVDIPTRFEFEVALHEERKKGYIPAHRLSELMIRSQKKWWGDWIEESELDDCFWISKGHFYIADGAEFYNYPYAVGYLLSRILFKKFNESPTVFTSIYENFLRATGKMSVEDIVKEFLNSDTTDPDFWLEGAPEMHF